MIYDMSYILAVITFLQFGLDGKPLLLLSQALLYHLIVFCLLLCDVLYNTSCKSTIKLTIIMSNV